MEMRCFPAPPVRFNVLLPFKKAQGHASAELHDCDLRLRRRVLFAGISYQGLYLD